MLKTIQEKFATLETNGAYVSNKQIKYFENFYRSPKNLETLKYYWTPEELILYADQHVIAAFDEIGGYDFSIESSAIYAKDGENALMVIKNRSDIKFFKAIILDIDDNSEIDED